jgi:hypothetical protein
MGGAGRIPWSKAMLFARENGIVLPDERERFWFLIGQMDASYLEWLAEREKAGRSDKPK